MNGPKASTGSRLLSEEITRREMSFQDVSQELLKAGYDIGRYSVWQWAHGISKPNLQNAFGIEAWSGGKISARSWNETVVPKVAAEKPAKKSTKRGKKS